MDKVFYFLFVVTNVLICVFVTVDMYQGKKSLDEMNKEFKQFHDISVSFEKNLFEMNKEIKEIHNSYKTFENFPPTFEK